jgi:hypothetical protein
MAKPKVSPSERFWARVNKQGPRQPHMETRCWIWEGKPGTHGYGCLGIDGTPVLTHRFSWQIHRGPVPKTKFILHHCDVRLCVKPSHLYVGTQKTNMRDKMQRGRHARSPLGGAKGTEHWAHKLNVFKVKIIRRSESSIRELATKFNVSLQTIRLVRRRKIWRHVP